MTQYNLSIFCIDGDTTFGIISSDKKLVYNYLLKHDHEGSSVNLVKHEGDTFVDIPYDNIYTELQGEQL